MDGEARKNLQRVGGEREAVRDIQEQLALHRRAERAAQPELPARPEPLRRSHQRRVPEGLSRHQTRPQQAAFQGEERSLRSQSRR